MTDETDMPTTERRKQRAARFLSDTTGSILPYVTLVLVVIVGPSVLALDGGRYMSLQTQLQKGADAPAPCRTLAFDFSSWAGSCDLAILRYRA